MTIETTLGTKLYTKKQVYMSSPIAISASVCRIYSKTTIFLGLFFMMNLHFHILTSLFHIVVNLFQAYNVAERRCFIWT